MIRDDRSTAMALTVTFRTPLLLPPSRKPPLSPVDCQAPIHFHHPQRRCRRSAAAMGLCGSTEAINPDFVDLSHFELLKVVGKGGFGKGERQLDAAGAKDQQRARDRDCPMRRTGPARLPFVWLLDRRCIELHDSVPSNATARTDSHSGAALCSACHGRRFSQ